MATIGLRDLYVDVLTSDKEGTAVYENEPTRLAKAISADLSINITQATLHADDGVDEAVSEFVDGELKLGTNDLSSEASAKILGVKPDSKGVLISKTGDMPVYVAVGFRAKKPNGKFKYVWLYKVKFNIPSESYKTKGESIEFTTPEITGKIIARTDGAWKADWTGDEKSEPGSTWFDKVYEEQPAA